MAPRLAGILVVALYLLVVCGSLLAMLWGERPQGMAFWSSFSLGLGFIGLAQIIVQFLLIARFRRLSAPFGIDIIMYYHRQVGTLAVLLIVAHPVVLVIQNPPMARLLNPFSGDLASLSGVWSLIALVALVLLSFFRRQFRLGYEVWRLTHRLLALAAVGLALVHVALIGPYVEGGWKLAYWIGLALVGIAALLYARVVKPLQQTRRPYRIAEIRPEADKTWSLVVEPEGHAGFRFSAGQFAWLKVGSPWSLDEHPFSFSSSAERPERLEFGIKEAGDFTDRIGQLDHQLTVYLDGPHGAFSTDRTPAEAYCFIAGGIGIVPILSMIRTLADRNDLRPLLLFYAARRREDLAYREELEALCRPHGPLDLTVVTLLEQPPEGWTGATGVVTPELLTRHWPDDSLKREVLLCGPDPMIAAVERALRQMGIPQRQIHYERFHLV